MSKRYFKILENREIKEELIGAIVELDELKEIAPPSGKPYTMLRGYTVQGREIYLPIECFEEITELLQKNTMNMIKGIHYATIQEEET